jgi:hypothetical protein
MFEPPHDPAEFRKVAVDRELGTVVWPPGAISIPTSCMAIVPPPTPRHRPQPEDDAITGS